MPTAAAAQGPALNPAVGGTAATPPTLAQRFNGPPSGGYSQVQGPGLAPWLKQSTAPLGGFTLGAPNAGTTAPQAGQPWYQADLDSQMAQAAALRQQQAAAAAAASAQQNQIPDEDKYYMEMYGIPKAEYVRAYGEESYYGRAGRGNEGSD